MARWFIKNKKVNIDKMCIDLGIHKPLAYALAGRNIYSRQAALDYMNLDNSTLGDITTLKDVKKAYSIIKEEIDRGTAICIYGDYDADGVMSTVILSKALSNLGANVTYFIPDRVEDGYGLSNSSVVNIAQAGIGLIITCDNGIAASEQIDLAIKLGMKVVVLDHHEPGFKEINGIRKDIVPPAHAVVDAKLKDSGYSFREMCAGGLCYRFSEGFYNYIGRDFSEIKNELLVFAGIATICDVVDLVGENRILASKALELLNSNVENVGLQALIDVKDLKHIDSYHIGFIIGPCINATGRLENASMAVDLFLTNSSEEAYNMAKDLSDLNDSRKLMTTSAVDEIIGNIGVAPKDKILVIYNEDIHESIAGIVAGRIKETFYRPAIVLTKSKEGVKGSARSIEDYNIFEGLYRERELLTSFGGHAMAAGLSLKKENIDILRERLNKNCDLSEDKLQPLFRIEGKLDLEDITTESADELKILKPFGKANETPLYGSIALRVAALSFIGAEKRYLRLVFRDIKGYEIRAVDFENYEDWITIINEEGYNVDTASMARPLVDIVYYLDVNEFNGNRNPQLRIKSVRKSKKI